ncbi:MAG TPA: nitroreductase family protein [Cryomorphaceae bacterium]|nr:nitroreductase family protein [Cryomorphaceae bacterium]
MQSYPPNGREDLNQSFIPYAPQRLSETEMIKRSAAFKSTMNSRRSVRKFSNDPVSRQAVVNAIATAATAPSGANKQPWSFCLISNSKLKSEIRVLAEEEEYRSYHGRMNEQWLEDLKPLGTDHNKPFLEDAPYVIVVFKKVFTKEGETRKQNYYVNESVGIATGMLLSALHCAGLSTLTHTPSPMNFLCKILGRPENEKPYLVIPVGFAHKENLAPNIQKKPLEEVLSEYV